jgi:hypothetical protein
VHGGVGYGLLAKDLWWIECQKPTLAKPCPKAQMALAGARRRGQAAEGPAIQASAHCGGTVQIGNLMHPGRGHKLAILGR